MVAIRDAGVAALNGLVGDALHQQGHGLAVRMKLRAEGPPTSTVVFLVHGLMATDAQWRMKDGSTYGSRLAGDRGATPVYVTYNSGRHVSDNGRELAQRIEAAVTSWPVP